ncbi:hypothetical protein B0H13DRAFT_1881573 [Mycena leptocephala]|nr:hypothetical protein B0H13DRAFT_1881573 [Mycena leptocephala]
MCKGKFTAEQDAHLNTYIPELLQKLGASVRGVELTRWKQSVATKALGTPAFADLDVSTIPQTEWFKEVAPRGTSGHSPHVSDPLPQKVFYYLEGMNYEQKHISTKFLLGYATAPHPKLLHQVSIICGNDPDSTGDMYILNHSWITGGFRGSGTSLSQVPAGFEFRT